MRRHEISVQLICVHDNFLSRIDDTQQAIGNQQFLKFQRISDTERLPLDQVKNPEPYKAYRLYIRTPQSDGMTRYEQHR